MHDVDQISIEKNHWTSHYSQLSYDTHEYWEIVFHHVQSTTFMHCFELPSHSFPFSNTKAYLCVFDLMFCCFASHRNLVVYTHRVVHRCSKLREQETCKTMSGMRTWNHYNGRNNNTSTDYPNRPGMGKKETNGAWSKQAKAQNHSWTQRRSSTCKEHSVVNYPLKF